MEDLSGPFNWEIISHIITSRLNERNRKEIHFDGSTNLKDIGFDSLDVMETIIEAEGAIKIKVKNSQIKNILTVGDIYKLFPDD